MSQIMIDLMVAMMPYMKPVAYLGMVAVGLSFLLAISQIIFGAGGRRARLTARLAIAIGLFFIACEIAGRFLGMEPTLLFSDDTFNREMFRNQWPFWTLGGGLVLSGVALRKLGQWSSIIH